MIGDAVERFLSRGGKVEQVIGFEYKPLPEYRPPKARVLKTRSRSGRKRVTDIEPREGQVRIEFIAHGAGYASPMGLRNKKVAALMPEPLKQRGPNGSLLYDKAEAMEAIRKIQELRNSFKKDVEEAVYGYAYAKKQRNKRELRKTWTV